MREEMSALRADLGHSKHENEAGPSTITPHIIVNPRAFT